MKTLVIVGYIILAIVASMVIYHCWQAHKERVKKKIMLEEKAAQERAARIEAERIQQEKLRNLLIENNSPYTKMLVISCYVKESDIGTRVNEETLRLVHVCRAVDQTLFNIEFDWIVYYEPRKNNYCDTTLVAIENHPKEKSLRLSCGCPRSNREDSRYFYGGENSECSRGSNENIYEICRCWLDKSAATSYSGKNSREFADDLRRLMSQSLGGA